MKKTVDTVSLILVRGGKVLVERRREDREPYPGAVVIPGDNVESGESFEEACRRARADRLDLEEDHKVIMRLFAEKISP